MLWVPKGQILYLISLFFFTLELSVFKTEQLRIFIGRVIGQKKLGTKPLPNIMLVIFVHRDNWPQSTSMNSMDVWQIMSYLNVFFVLGEYCLVLWLSKAVPLEEMPMNKILQGTEADHNVKQLKKVWDFTTFLGFLDF